MNKVYIIILNYKNWKDTVECLESLLKINYSNYQIIVVDNNSPNDSIIRLKSWMLGLETLDIQPKEELKHLSSPVSKPIDFRFLSQVESEQKNNFKERLILISSGKNEGYSAGNNIGLKYGLLQGDADFFWILNNDVVVESESLKFLVEKAIFYNNSNRKIGIIGSKVMYYHLPEIIQAVGGSFFQSKFARLGIGLGDSEQDYGQYDREVEVDFITGACMLVSKEYIESVGLLAEEYFLFFEEPDWVERGKKLDWLELGYSWEAKIYHKEGGASGGGAHRRKDIRFFPDFYVQRNKILFTRKFFPAYLPLVYISLVGIIIKRILSGKWRRIPKLVSGMFNTKSHF